MPNNSSLIVCSIIVELDTTDTTEDTLENTNCPTSERGEVSEDSFATSGGGSSTTNVNEKHSVAHKKHKGLNSTFYCYKIIICV